MLQSFVETPTPSDWAAFKSNTHRVQELDLRSWRTKDGRLSQRALGDIAQTRPDMVIFPHLRQLRTRIKDLTPLFMTVSVSELCVQVELHETASNRRIFQAMVARVQEYLPGLKKLRIDSRPNHARFEEQLPMLFNVLPKLAIVLIPCQVLSPATLQSLSSLRDLTRLYVETKVSEPVVLKKMEDATGLETADVPLRSGAFPALRYFGCCFLSIDSSLRLLLHEHFPCATLTGLWVCFTYGGGRDSAVVKVFLESVCSHLKSLEMLSIRFSELIITESGPSDEGEEQPLQFKDIATFLDMRTLTGFSVEHPCPIRMTEEDAYAVAIGGRRFTEIWLSPAPRWPSACPLLPLRTLALFAASCPRLRRLGLCLDCTTPAEMPADGIKLCRVVELFVGDSLVIAHKRRMFKTWFPIARYLASILPPGCRVRASSGPLRADPDNPSRWVRPGRWLREQYPYIEEAWVAISQMTKVIQEVRMRMSEESIVWSG